MIKIRRELDDLAVLIEWFEVSQNPAIDRAEIEEQLHRVETLLEQLSWAQRFSETDDRACYLELASGSGGIEAQDWTQMLLRMYLKWATLKSLIAEIISISEGEEAGIKNATVRICGPYAYGWMRTETGVHRLVRCSPFDSNHRRHTSFGAVYVYPEVSESRSEIDIRASDLRVDLYRASGAGGQHVNRTESAVRMTHLPTGIVVQCQSDRSQHRNRDRCLAQLKAKIFQRAQEEKEREQAAQNAAKADIGWGAQIRSYTLDDSRVKDLRTGIESRNPTAILEGNLELFVLPALLKFPTQPG